MKVGIDISKHQGNLDFDEIKDKFDFVIIRVAVGDDLTEDDSECSQCDSMAQTYIDECNKRGIPFAIYIYQYAGNTEQAISEAEHIKEWYRKSNPVLGVALDIEDADSYKVEHGISYSDTQALALTWLQELKDLPVPKMIYASHSWLDNYLNVDELIEAGAIIWEAHWNNDGEICDDRFDLSQESSDYYLDDGTRVDYDIMRDEFFDNLVNTTSNNSTTWTHEQAVDVINAMYNGLFGRGYTQGENEALENLLMNEWTRVQTFDDLRSSDEYKKKHLIIDCYMVMRGSVPSDEELNDWMQVESEDDIKNGILYSDEFNNKYNV